MTIRQRLTLWYAALLTLIIIGFGAITFGVVRVLMVSTIDTTLRETATIIASDSTLVQIPEFGSPPRVDIQLASLDMFRASDVYIQAWELVNGEPVWDSSSLNVADYGDPLDPRMLGSAGVMYSNVRIEGNDLRVLTQPIVFSNGRLVGNIQVAGSLKTVNRATDILLAVMVVSCVLAIGGAALLSMWFAHRALQPIEQITHAAASIAVTDDLRTRLLWSGPEDELGRLVNVFNHMMVRIENLFKVQQRFVADISHELRTPLTAIRGNLEIGRRYGLDEAAIAAIEDEAGRMSRLVNDLLLLARADYGGMAVELMPVDLDTVVMEAFQKGKALAQGRSLQFRMAHFEPIRVLGNPDRLQQVLLNLIGNAIKFTPDGGQISIGVRHDAKTDTAVLWVTDTGIGIHADELSRIFDRFYQSDPARTHNGGGFGLGLSIAKWIVDAHHGSITATSVQGQGTTITVTLPVQGGALLPGHDQVTRPRLPIIRRGDSAISRRPAPEVHIARSDDDRHHTG